MLIVGECLTLAEAGTVEAVLIEGGRILEVGLAEDLGARHPGVKRLRVERVTPGIHDAHVHPLSWGLALEELDLAGFGDPAAAADQVAQRVTGLAPGKWIRGRGYLFQDEPPAGLLDAAAPDNPVLLRCRDLHSAWANRRALEMVGIGEGTPDPPGGRFSRDGSGLPTGYVFEHAADPLLKALPAPRREDLERGLADLAGRGYTATHGMDFEPDEALEWAEELAGEGKLPLRLWWTVSNNRWRETTPGWRGHDLEVAAMKMFADGSLGSRTAWMHEPYPDGSCGMPQDPPDLLEEEGSAALAAGYTLAIHALGSRAVETVCGVVQKLAPGATRPIRLEHLQHVRDQELLRLSQLPVAISLQPIHLDADVDLVRRHQPGREGLAFRFRDLWNTGKPVALGSDAPVEDPDLLRGLAAATGHALDPTQSLSPEQALWGFTRGAALAAGWDDYGVLRPGARADLAVWEDGRLVGRFFKGEAEWLESSP